MALVVPIAVASKKVANRTGIVVTEHLVPQVEQQGEAQVIRQLPLLGVCWDDGKGPAIDYVSPAELQFLGIVDGLDDEDEDDEDYEDDEDEDDERELSAPPPAS